MFERYRGNAIDIRKKKIKRVKNILKKYRVSFVEVGLEGIEIVKSMFTMN